VPTQKPEKPKFLYSHARPEPVEGRPARSWFDKLTTNESAHVTIIVKGSTKLFVIHYTREHRCWDTPMGRGTPLMVTRPIGPHPWLARRGVPVSWRRGRPKRAGASEHAAGRCG